jgi:hypothetical protein
MTESEKGKAKSAGKSACARKQEGGVKPPLQEDREAKSGPPRKEGLTRRRTHAGLWSGGWASKLVRVMHWTTG